MQATYIVLLVVATMAYCAPTSDKPHYNLKEAPVLFEKYIKDYNKVYKDDADKDVHYKEFVKSLEVINKANEESSSATFDINQFTDYTPEQRKHLTGLAQPEK